MTVRVRPLPTAMVPVLASVAPAAAWLTFRSAPETLIIPEFVEAPRRFRVVAVLPLVRPSFWVR